MSPTSLPPTANRVRGVVLIAGLVSLAICMPLSLRDPKPFFQSYLVAYLFVLSIPMGCLAILMLHKLTGGTWGTAIRPILEAAARTTPLILVLFLPILAGMKSLYPWTDAAHVSHDELLRHKALYLNVPFFLARAAVYFTIWLGLAFAQNRLARRYEHTGDPAVRHRLTQISGPGLVLYCLTMTFAAFDWMMSLDPHWQSTIYGLAFLAGQGLAAFAFSLIVLTLLSRARPVSETVTAETLNDLGNLTLAFVMLWAYMTISQYLIIWSGNLPEEIGWYLPRMAHGWAVLGVAIVVFHFAVPFLLLLSRKIKRTPRLLLIVVSTLLAMRLVDLYWILAPGFHPEGFRPSATDLLAPVGIGGVWLAFFLRELGKRPLVAADEPGTHAIAEGTSS